MKYTFTILIIIIARITLAQNVIDFRISNFDTSGLVVYMHQSRLISKEILNDTLKLKIGLELPGQRCNKEFGIEMELKNDSLLIAILPKSSPHLQRSHYVEIEIDAKDIKDTSFILYLKRFKRAVSGYTNRFLIEFNRYVRDLL